jgi:hypothetical protein
VSGRRCRVAERRPRGELVGESLSMISEAVDNTVCIDSGSPPRLPSLAKRES